MVGARITLVSRAGVTAGILNLQRIILSLPGVEQLRSLVLTVVQLDEGRIWESEAKGSAVAKCSTVLCK